MDAELLRCGRHLRWVPSMARNPWSRRRARLFCAALGLASLAGSIAVIAPASAAINNCTAGGAGGNYFDGYVHVASSHTDQFEGASAYIANRAAYTCGTDTTGPDPAAHSIGSNFTTAWVMIADYDLKSWSQVGVIAGFDQVLYYWAQVWVHNSSGTSIESFNRFLPTSTDPNARHAYYEKVVRSCPLFGGVTCEQSLVDNTLVTETNFNPFTDAYWADGGGGSVRWSPQYSAEKSYQSNDILGTPAVHENFSGLGIQKFPTDAIVSEPCTLTVVKTATRSALAPSSCIAFDTWTTSTS